MFIEKKIIITCLCVQHIRSCRRNAYKLCKFYTKLTIHISIFIYKAHITRHFYCQNKANFIFCLHLLKHISQLLFTVSHSENYKDYR